MLTPTLRLGRLGGVEIGIHWSWIAIFALIVWSLAAEVFPNSNPGLEDSAYVAMALVAVPLFFISLLLHELGHASQARREGMSIEGITLWLLGGVARFRGTFPSAGAEFRIAIAGPIVSLGIGALALSFALLVPLPPAVDGVVFWLGYINLALLVFNMLPAMPLDGGRVLRSALWARKHDYVAATRTAAGWGRAFGQTLIALGLLTAVLGGGIGGLWLALIGWFVLMAATAELAAAQAHEALGGLSVADVMASEPVVTEPAETLDRFMRGPFARTRHVAYPVVDGDRALGLITFRDALAVPEERWPRTRVEEVMTPLAQLPELTPELALETGFERLSDSESNRAPVIADGRLAGLLSITDAARLIQAATLATHGNGNTHNP